MAAAFFFAGAGAFEIFGALFFTVLVFVFVAVFFFDGIGKPPEAPFLPCSMQSARDAVIRDDINFLLGVLAGFILGVAFVGALLWWYCT